MRKMSPIKNLVFEEQGMSGFTLMFASQERDQKLIRKRRC
jgi:hypothetical protein